MSAGLCERCAHVKLNRNDRDSVFIYCRRAESDRRYPKYPPLPVRQCPGFEAAPKGPADIMPPA